MLSGKAVSTSEHFAGGRQNRKESHMKNEFHSLLLDGFATLALLAPQAPAQTQYSMSILPVPPHIWAAM
jgi:hypothetical protein